MLAHELKRAFHNRTFLSAFLIALGCLGYGLYNYNRGYLEVQGIPGIDPFRYNVFDALLFARFDLIMLIAPLLSAFPFADSFSVERSNGYRSLVLLRTKNVRYVTSKFIANALAGGLVLFSPHVLIYILSDLIYPNELPTYLGQQRLIITGPFSEIYPIDPALYVWIIMILSFLFGAIYSSLGMAISMFIENRYVIIATPFLIYLMGTFILANLRLEFLLPSVTFAPYQVTTSSFESVFGELVLLLIFAAVIIILCSRKVFQFRYFSN